MPVHFSSFNIISLLNNTLHLGNDIFISPALCNFYATSEICEAIYTRRTLSPFKIFGLGIATKYLKIFHTILPSIYVTSKALQTVLLLDGSRPGGIFRAGCGQFDLQVPCVPCHLVVVIEHCSLCVSVFGAVSDGSSSTQLREWPVCLSPRCVGQFFVSARRAALASEHWVQVLKSHETAVRHTWHEPSFTV